MSSIQGETIKLSEENFEREVIESEAPFIIDFWAPWCGPCKAIGPVLEKLSTRWAGQIKVGKVNVDEEPGIAGAFNIQSIPTVVAMQGNKVIDMQIGFGGEKRLRELFETAAAKLPKN
jgi:thioredoxin 1